MVEMAGLKIHQISTIQNFVTSCYNSLEKHVKIKSGPKPLENANLTISVDIISGVTYASRRREKTKSN